MRNDRGFTLVELLVTVTIIGVLAAIVTVGVSGASSTSQNKANQANFSSVQSAIDSWLASNSTMTYANIVLNTADASSTSAGWYAADGVATTAVLNTNVANFYGVIDFTQATGSPAFNTFLRLNAGSSLVCVLPKATATATAPTTASLYKCHN